MVERLAVHAIGRARAVETADAVVVGAGIFGMSLAWELASRRRRRIVVLERRYSGAGSSGRNVGRVRAIQLTPELARLSIEAQAKHVRLGDELGSNTLLWRAGYALVLYEDSEVEHMREARDMLSGLGLAPELLGPRETLRRLPILAGGQRPTGALAHHDYIVHHDAVMHAYRRSAAEAGVELRENAPVEALLMSGSRVEGVRTPAGEIRSPIVVNATGAWSREVSALAGLEVPNTPIRREALVTEAARPFMREAITFYRPVEGWFNQTLRGELVAGVLFPDEPAGPNLEASHQALGHAARTLLSKAPRLGHLRVVRQWAGLYDMTPDRMATVGPVEGRPGLVQANGCNGRGFAIGPLIGELLARWLDTGQRPDLLALLDANRFAGREGLPVLTADYYAGYRKR